MSEHRSNVSSAQHKEMLMQHIQGIMLQIAGDQIALLEVVAAGEMAWRNLMRQAFEPFPLGDVPDRVFLFFCRRLVEVYGNPFEQDAARMADEAALKELARGMSGETLDSIEEKAPPSAVEIAQQWKMDDFSSEDAQRQEAEVTGMHPLAHFDRLVEQMVDEAKAGKVH